MLQRGNSYRWSGLSELTGVLARRSRINDCTTLRLILLATHGVSHGKER